MKKNNNKNNKWAYTGVEQQKDEDWNSEDWKNEEFTVPCIICGKKLKPNEVFSFEDDPYCFGCLNGQN